MKSFKQYLEEMPGMNTVSKDGNQITDRDGKFDRTDTTRLPDLKGHEVHHLAWQRKSGAVSHDFWVVDPQTKKIQMNAGGSGSNEHVKINGLAGRQGSPVKAHEMYAHIMKHTGMEIHSDNSHSVGGKKTWEKLSQNPDIHVSHHDSEGNEIHMHRGEEFDMNMDDKSTHFRAKKK